MQNRRVALQAAGPPTRFERGGANAENLRNDAQIADKTCLLLMNQADCQSAPQGRFIPLSRRTLSIS